MGLESAIAKLDKYFKRLKKGKAQKIKPGHITKVLGKLEAKERILKTELSDTEKADKKKRLNQKLALVQEQQERARWLQKEISGT